MKEILECCSTYEHNERGTGMQGATETFDVSLAFAVADSEPASTFSTV